MIALINLSVIPLARQAVRIGPEDRYLSEWKVLMGSGDLARGDEAIGTTWSYPDLTALGRQENWEGSPGGYPQTPRYKWWNWHDNYDAEASPDPKWVKISDAGVAAFCEGDAEA